MPPLSDETLHGLRTQLMRPEFDRHVSREGRLWFLARAEPVSITGAHRGCRDPDDDELLETALLGKADALAPRGWGPPVRSSFGPPNALRPQWRATSPTPIERIASDNDVPCATITSTRPTAWRRSPPTRAPSPA